LDEIFSPEESTALSDLLVSSSNDGTSSSSTSSTWFRHSRYRPDRRRAHCAKGFYPYPTGDSNDGRSVASVRIVGEPFEKRAANKDRTFVPCFFYGAHSCSGREYTKNQHHAPLQLSKTDAEKWSYQKDDTLVLIGGGNYESIIHEVDEATAERVGSLLDPDDGDRDDALDYLQAEGYDTGSPGPSQPTTSLSNQQSSGQSSGEDPPTDAERLQQRAKRGDVEQSLTHSERRLVANRLLTIGDWDTARCWFQEQYGNDFDPQRTWKGLRGVVKQFPEDFNHIQIPPKP